MGSKGESRIFSEPGFATIPEKSTCVPESFNKGLTQSRKGAKNSLRYENCYPAPISTDLFSAFHRCDANRFVSFLTCEKRLCAFAALREPNPSNSADLEMRTAIRVARGRVGVVVCFAHPVIPCFFADTLGGVAEACPNRGATPDFAGVRARDARPACTTFWNRQTSAVR